MKIVSDIKHWTVKQTTPRFHQKEKEGSKIFSSILHKVGEQKLENIFGQKRLTDHHQRQPIHNLRAENCSSFDFPLSLRGWAVKHIKRKLSRCLLIR